MTKYYVGLNLEGTNRAALRDVMEFITREGPRVLREIVEYRPVVYHEEEEIMLAVLGDHLDIREEMAVGTVAVTNFAMTLGRPMVSVGKKTVSLPVEITWECQRFIETTLNQKQRTVFNESLLIGELSKKVLKTEVENVFENI